MTMLITQIAFLQAREFVRSNFDIVDYIAIIIYTTPFNSWNFLHRKNMAVVHLFFVDSQFTQYIKNELFGFTEFLCKYPIS